MHELHMVHTGYSTRTDGSTYYSCTNFTGCRQRRAVVAEGAHGLGQGPAGGGVCGEAPVVHCKGCGVRLIAQVLEVLGHRHRPQHSLRATDIVEDVIEVGQQKHNIKEKSPRHDPGRRTLYTISLVESVQM